MSQYAVVNPATGETIRRFDQISDADLASRIEDASSAYRSWSRATSVAERAALVRRVSELHSERREALADIVVREVGKPVAQALGEVDFCADIYGYYADNAEALLRDEEMPLRGTGRSGGSSALIRKTSMGPLLGIMPWNYPYYQVARFAAPNLALGNPILLKPAPQCPESGEALQAIFDDAGFPPGAFSIILASNEQIADSIADPRIMGVSVTGSERAGSAIAEIAGRHLKKVVLELGGSDPFLVLAAADLDHVVAAAVKARTSNTGQACNAAKRFIVLDEFYDEFVEKFSASMQEIEPGEPTTDGVRMGPLSSKAAADRLEGQVDRAVAQGAEIVVGGARRENYFSPTVLTNIGSDNDARREEFFGPVAAVYRVRSEQEAIDVANDTPFGLGSYIFSDDREQALRVADQIEAGIVVVNGASADAAELPFGGIKRSGFGRELGPYGIDEFANKKLIRIYE